MVQQDNEHRVAWVSETLAARYFCATLVQHYSHKRAQIGANQRKFGRLALPDFWTWKNPVTVEITGFFDGGDWRTRTSDLMRVKHFQKALNPLIFNGFFNFRCNICATLFYNLAQIIASILCFGHKKIPLNHKELRGIDLGFWWVTNR